jgi:Flp pilus assembly protein TadD
MNKIRIPSLLCCAMAGIFLAGCAEMPFFGERTVSRRAVTSPSAASAAASDQSALRDGIRLYNEGQFDDAIKRLSSKDITNGSTATRVSALKYTAFSYCVTSRAEQCRQAFERALKLNPKFDLAPGEHGHPQWGPVFTRAKRD